MSLIFVQISITMISLKLAKLKSKEIKSCIKGHTVWTVAVTVVTQLPGDPDFRLGYDSQLERRELAGRKMAYSKPLLLALVRGLSHWVYSTRLPKSQN